MAQVIQLSSRNDGLLRGTAGDATCSGVRRVAPG